MTSTNDPRVEAHWTAPDLEATILGALERAGKDLDALTIADLAPVDEFHVRGRAATQELADLAEVRADWRVLDVGSGLGGSARYLAASYGCRVTGLDLTRSYCDVATALSRRLGMSGLTEFRCGTASALPFADGSFDLVWTEHTQMNIADKAGFYAELVRVGGPGARLAFHDVFLGPAGEVRFPVPWARDASLSHLITPEAAHALLDSLGLVVRHWRDVSQESLTFFERLVERTRRQGPPPLGTHLLSGGDAAVMHENQRVNLAEGRILVIEAVLDTTRR
jgi:SAM-dependent methyltransferase